MAYLLIVSLLGVGSLVYLSVHPVRGRDAVVLAFAFSLVFFLSRFDALATVWLGDYPLVGIHLYLLTVLAVLGLVRALDGRPLRPVLARPLPFLAAYAAVSVVSGLVNGGLDGVLPALQIVVITVTPALLAWILVEFDHQPGRPAGDLRRLFVLPLGVVTPLILVVSALMPGLFAGLLGWRVSADFGGFEGFVRGWSPMGSTIDTGCLVVIAFGFALHEALVNRSTIHKLIAGLAAGSILFTASRTVMIMFVLFNLIYWGMIRRWRAFLRVAALPALAMLALLGWSLFTGQVSFHRFLVLSDQSTGRRAASMAAAADLAREQPLLGHGPGLVYHEIRTTWLANPRQVPLVMEKMLKGRISAMEPHNLYLYLLAEHGVLAALAFLAALFGGLLALWRLPVHDDVGARSGRALFVGLWVPLAVVLGTGSWPLLAPQVSVFFWLFVFMGLDLADSRRREVAAAADRSGAGA